MLLPIADLLDIPTLKSVRRLLANAPRYAGVRSAGWAARAVKLNTQFEASAPAVMQAAELIQAALLAHPVVQLAARTAKLSPVHFNAYCKGQSYGLHTDDAYMSDLRTDLSYTLFLSERDSYEGGELIIDDHSGEQGFRLEAGGLLLYPADSLHQVTAVVRGERLAAFGWLQSQVRDASERAILFDLELVRRHLHATEAGSAEFLRLSRVCGSLARRWSGA